MMPGFRGQLAMHGGPVPYLPIPAMTSNTTPAGWEAFASSVSSASEAVAAWNAFNVLDTSGYWASSSVTPPHYVGLSAPAQFKVVRYAISTGNAVGTSPRDFELQGSTDDLVWDVLDSRTGVTWAAAYQRQEWDVASPGAYSYHRLVVTANASNTQTRVSELELLQEDDL